MTDGVLPYERTVQEATEAALAEATHLTAADAGAVQTLRVLARKIDTDDQVRETLLDLRVAMSEYAAGGKAPQMDNVSVPTYLKFCESLGLTPAGRVKLAEKKEPKGGTLSKLRDANAQQGRTRPRRAAG